MAMLFSSSARRKENGLKFNIYVCVHYNTCTGIIEKNFAVIREKYVSP